jgi:hypothetical protein
MVLGRGWLVLGCAVWVFIGGGRQQLAALDIGIRIFGQDADVVVMSCRCNGEY